MIDKSDILLIDTSYLDTKDWHIDLEDVKRYAQKYPLKKFYAIHRDDYIFKNSLPNLYFPEDGETITII